MRSSLVAVCVLLGICVPAAAQIRIGINLQVYPDLVPVPGYPVYYAPQLDSNLFFYDGQYWIYAQDNWYAGSWYNGPWDLVSPDLVPLFVLRVPVRYYRRPPPYFRDWALEAPPRWGEHWGRDWEQHRSGWDHWDRATAPLPAPPPTYQRQYSGDRYPRVDQQQALQSENYHYQPRDAVVRQHFQQSSDQAAPTPRHVRAEQGSRTTPPPDDSRANATHDNRGTNAPVATERGVAGRAESRPQPGGQTERPAPRQPDDAHTQGQGAQGPPQRESQPPRGQRTDRPPADSQGQEPQRDSEHGRDH